MKNVSGPEGSIFRKKGFFIALYSCLGAVAVLAIVITFANRSQPYQEPGYEDDTVYAGADQVESYLAQADQEAWFRPRQQPTPSPAPQPTPPPQLRPTPTPLPPQEADPPEPEPPEPPRPEQTEQPEPEARVETFTAFTSYDRLMWPVYGEVSMPFSLTSLVYDPTLDQFRTNDNLRIAAEEGDPVRAGADGRVIAIGRNIRHGQYITIDHGDGWEATYGQLMANVLVSEGEIVRAGQVIGGIGQPSIFGSGLGTHLHLRVARDDQAVNPYELLEARE